MIELIFTAVIIVFASSVLYKKMISKKANSGSCGCSSCSSDCPKYSGNTKE